MILCDKCGQPIEFSPGFVPRKATAGRHICDDCGLLLDATTDTIAPAQDRRELV